MSERSEPTNVSMTPGSRPRRGVIGVLALLGAGALATAVAIGVGEASSSPPVAAAVDLERFGSCDDLATWGTEALGGVAMGESDMAPTGAVPTTVAAFDGDSAAESAGAPAAASDGAGRAASEGGSEATGGAADSGDDTAGGAPVEDGTNVAVEGVDELDLVDRLGEDVVLVVGSGTLSVVDLAAGEVVAGVTVPGDAQVTYDAEAGVAWVVGSGASGGVEVDRYAASTEGLEHQGGWSTTGWLVDARRVGDELHVVAADGFGYPVPEGEIDPPVTEVPVAPDQQVEPVEPGSDGDDVDSGDGADVVADDQGGTVSSGGSSASDTPLATVPFADGPVACDAVLHPEGPSDATATLLVTLSATGPVEPTRAAEVVGSGQLVHVTTDAAYVATPQWDQQTGVTTTGIHRFDLDTLEPTGSGTVEGSLLDDFSMSEHDGVLRVATTVGGGGCCVGPMPVDIDGDVAVARPPGTAVPDDSVAAGLNEIVVLDTDGALDEVGRTERFGKPGETLHGIRFAGTTAYAVTFLQTDPFYVVDLTDPAAPAVVGEVELPGFSSYLHPLGDGLVVGFGPGEDGRATAKLFDVSDPTAPAVVGDLVLGDESAVTWDHHAYVDLGDGRFAVPASTYRYVEAPPLPPGDGQDDVGRDPAVVDTGMTSSVVVVDTAGGRLDVDERHDVPGVESAQRVIPATDGWALLDWSGITLLDADGAVRGTISLA